MGDFSQIKAEQLFSGTIGLETHGESSTLLAVQSSGVTLA